MQYMEPTHMNARVSGTSNFLERNSKKRLLKSMFSVGLKFSTEY